MARTIVLVSSLTVASVVMWLALGSGGGQGPEGVEDEERTGSAQVSTGEQGALWCSEASPFVPGGGENLGDELFAYVQDCARARAGAPYVSPDGSLPSALEEMDYDAYRAIAFQPEEALWRERARFEVQFFHPGFLYPDPVRIHRVDEDGAQEVQLDVSSFVYGPPALRAEEAVVEHAEGLNPAGFRIHYPLHEEEIKDEVAVFLGASYFRLLGPGHVHGLSSRGVTVDTWEDEGEEFPDFREFWLVDPGPEESELAFVALLEGPSLAGAYRFHLRPGDSRGARTWMDVEAHLFARRDVGKLGVAPLTSMFLFDDGIPSPIRGDDFRGRVHDSDGLLMRTGEGEWIWRPLSNPPHLQVTSLLDDGPDGFGLLQRERRFDRYLDIEAQYQRRPSQWVQVEDDWGRGRLELVEIPTESEFNDNIVGHWIPDEPFRAGDERVYRYRIVMFDRDLDWAAPAQVERTRVGWDALPGEADPPPRSRRRFVVDFVPGPNRGGEAPVPEGEPVVEAELEVSAGRASGLQVLPLPEGEGWRVTFRLDPDEDRPADMRLYLTEDGERMSETWSYLWEPARAEP